MSVPHCGAGARSQRMAIITELLEYIPQSEAWWPCSPGPCLAPNRSCPCSTRPHSLAMLSPAQAPDSAIQGGLPKAGHDPAVPLRVPGREERVEAVRDGLRAADE